MLKILFKTESHYTIDRRRIRNLIEEILKKRGVKGKVEISVVVVGDRFMRGLNRKFLKKDETATILTFPLSNTDGKTPFIDLPDKVLRLGDIVISYPAARGEAAEEEKLVDEKIDELVGHGMMHLLGG